MSTITVTFTITEPGEENGEVRYNEEPGDEIPQPTNPDDSSHWFDDY